MAYFGSSEHSSRILEFGYLKYASSNSIKQDSGYSRFKFHIKRQKR